MLMLCALVSAWCSIHAYAGVPEGVDAFTRARYADARKELAGPAEEGDAQAMVYMLKC